MSEWVPKVGDDVWMLVHVGEVDGQHAHVSGWGWEAFEALRPADDPSVMDMLAAVFKVGGITIRGSGTKPGLYAVFDQRKGLSIVARDVDLNAAIRAAYDAVVKETT